MKPFQTPTSYLSTAVALALGLAAAPAPVAFAQDSQAMLEEVVVTGTRRKDRSVADSAVPIDILSEEMLQTSGLTETNQLLSQLLPSFNFPQASINDGTDHVRPAQLRGLSPDHTLVLINGKRRHSSALVNLNGSMGRGSSAVDMNMIPANAIKRIEVLRDGAAAQYGSDAIAGVINIVLKDQNSGGSVSAIYGEYDTEMAGVPGVSGVSIDPSGALVINESGPRKRSDGGTLTLRADSGFALGEEGFLHIAAEFRDRDFADRSGYDPRNNYATVDGISSPSELTVNRFNHIYGNAEVEDVSLFFNAAIPLSNGFEAYAFGSYGGREGVSGGFYRRAQDSRNILAIYPDGFLPKITSDINDYSVALGVRGVYAGWDVDASVLVGENELEYGVTDSLNTSLGPTSPTSFYAGGLTNGHTVINFNASQLMELNGMPVNIAFGAEYRDDSYEIDPGEEASYIQGPFAGAAGSQVFPGFTPESRVDQSRDSIGLYLDIDADITSKFNVAIAGRYEDFSDFGSTFNAKLASRYELTDTFAIRGSTSTGFRAPSLAQQSFTSIATIFVDGVPTETGTFRPDSDVALALGSPGLEEETATSYSLGFSWTPLDNLSVTFDYYDIEIEDRIVLSENLSGDGIAALLAGTGANRGRFFLNAITSETKGFDVVVNYDLDLDAYGSLTMSAGYNRTDNDVTDIIDPPAQLAQVGVAQDNLFSRREVQRFERAAPEDKLNLSANWRYGDLGVNLRVNRFGEAVDPGTTEATDEVLDAKWITDLEASYDVTSSTTIALGANNLFDVYPETTESIREGVGSSAGTFDLIFPYSSFSPFGFMGRFVYLRATYSFE